MIATKYVIKSGKGMSAFPLVSFDNALQDAGVGNYNLVRLSSILPAGCRQVDSVDLPEGSLLPTAYSTISSKKYGDRLVSAIGVGIPKDPDNVGVIMEHSTVNVGIERTLFELHMMIREAFLTRKWELKDIKDNCSYVRVSQDGITHTAFACIAEW